VAVAAAVMTFSPEFCLDLRSRQPARDQA